MNLTKLIFVATAFLSTGTEVVTQLYEWKCCIDDVLHGYTLPSIQGGPFHLDLTSSPRTNTDIYPVPSTINCSGRVSGMLFCYGAIRSNIIYGVNYPVFKLLTLKQNGLTFRITDTISFSSTPTQQNCADLVATQTGLQLVRCCDYSQLDSTDQFYLPSPGFAFATVPTSSVITLLRYYNHTFVEYYTLPASILGTPAIGNNFTAYIKTTGTLRIIDFHITPTATEQPSSTEQPVTTTDEEPTTTEQLTTPEEPTTAEQLTTPEEPTTAEHSSTSAEHATTTTTTTTSKGPTTIEQPTPTTIPKGPTTTDPTTTFEGPATAKQQTTASTEPSKELSASSIAGIAVGGGGAVIIIILLVTVTAIAVRFKGQRRVITSRYGLLTNSSQAEDDHNDNASTPTNEAYCIHNPQYMEMFPEGAYGVQEMEEMDAPVDDQVHRVTTQRRDENENLA